MTNIVVVGSLSMDLVVQVPTIPKPGETVLGNNFTTYPSGKGANNAVGALTVTKMGIQSPLPTRTEVSEFLCIQEVQ
jgi:ribokinase